jgi:hypothetical protein
MPRLYIVTTENECLEGAEFSFWILYSGRLFRPIRNLG